MNRTRWILAVLLLGLAGLVLFQHQQLLGLRSENEGLRLRLIQGQEQTVPPPKTAEVTAEELERLRQTEASLFALRDLAPSHRVAGGASIR